MADWQRTLDIKESWEKAKKDEIPSHILAKEIAEKLRAMPPLAAPYSNSPENYINSRADEIAEEFEKIANHGDETDSVDWFNYAMAELYDWADISLDGRFGGKKNCWVRAAI